MFAAIKHFLLFRASAFLLLTPWTLSSPDVSARAEVTVKRIGRGRPGVAAFALVSRDRGKLGPTYLRTSPPDPPGASS
jgi:hypothetical protein